MKERFAKLGYVVHRWRAGGGYRIFRRNRHDAHPTHVRSDVALGAWLTDAERWREMVAELSGTDFHDCDYRTACHEAGHAVIGRLLMGVRCEYATIIPGRRYAGRVQYYTRDLIPENMSAEWYHHGKHRTEKSVYVAQMMSILAGDAAQDVFTLGRYDGGAVGDYQQLNELAKAAHYHGIENFERLEEATRCVVIRHWRAIHKIAVALLERKRLTGAQIDKLLGQRFFATERRAHASPVRSQVRVRRRADRLAGSSGTATGRAALGHEQLGPFKYC